MSQNRVRVPGPAEPIAIREARPDDVPDLVGLESAAFASDRLSRRSFRTLMKRRSALLLVAHDHTGLAGYALVLTRNTTRTARLYSLAIFPRLAGRGIGALLLAAAEAAAAGRGAAMLRLEVRADNRSAIRLYERHGYRSKGCREGYYEDGADALLFERSLKTETTGAFQRPIGRAA